MTKTFSLQLLLLLSAAHGTIRAIPLHTKNDDSSIDLILCALKSPPHLCEFECTEEFFLEGDHKGINIAKEQRQRSTISKFNDYECATIRNLREGDAGHYKLYVTKEDGNRRIKKELSLTENVLRNLCNGRNFNMSTSRSIEGLPIPVYWRSAESDRPEALQLTADNGTVPDGCSIALLITAQNPDTPVNPTIPTGTSDPPRNVDGNVKVIRIAVRVGAPVITITIFIILIIKCKRNREVPGPAGLGDLGMDTVT